MKASLQAFKTACSIRSQQLAVPSGTIGVTTHTRGPTARSALGDPLVGMRLSAAREIFNPHLATHPQC